MGDLAHKKIFPALYHMVQRRHLDIPVIGVAKARRTDEHLNCDIAIESRVKPEVLDQLRLKGHNLNVRKEYSSWMGRGQAVLHNSKTGVNFAGSDPRADGAAVPEPVPQPPK